MGELDVPVLDVGVSFIQRLGSPGGTLYVLGKFREYHILMVKILHNYMQDPVDCS